MLSLPIMRTLSSYLIIAYCIISCCYACSKKIQVTTPNERTSFATAEVKVGETRFVLKELDHLE
eukprot:Pgem_evm1s19160